MNVLSYSYTNIPLHFRERLESWKIFWRFFITFCPCWKTLCGGKIQKSTKIKMEITYSLATQREFTCNILMYIFLVFLCIYIFIKYDIYVFMYIYLPHTYIHNLKKKK